MESVFLLSFVECGCGYVSIILWAGCFVHCVAGYKRDFPDNAIHSDIYITVLYLQIHFCFDVIVTVRSCYEQLKKNKKRVDLLYLVLLKLEF